jgi:hypothetical protein
MLSRNQIKNRVSELTTDGEQGLKEILSYLKGEFGTRFLESYYTDFKPITFIATTPPEGFQLPVKEETFED